MKKPVIFVELKIASKERYTCDIAEKLFNSSKTLTIYCRDAAVLSKLDGLLWTWKQESFIPHKIFEPANGEAEAVLLTSNANNLPLTDVIILFDPLDSTKLKQYTVIIDFAEVYHAEKKIESRQRFKQMRDSGLYDMHFMQLGAFLSRNAQHVTPA